MPVPPSGSGRRRQRVAVTGATGRLGRAAVAAFRDAGSDVVTWSRPAYDLDDPAAAERAVAAELPDLVVHAAAWTDVDGCARDPQQALRRNGEAVRELALACAARSAGLVVVSTNEVFDGRRTDGRGYAEDEPVAPANPYGQSKLAGERLAVEAWGRSAGTSAGVHAGLWIVRTAWLFGAPGNDFPERIVAAADRLGPDEPLRVVADEHGSPTAATDLAAALVTLVRVSDGGLFHLVNAGHASRFECAERILRQRGRSTPLEAIDQRDYPRASTPPRWGVLATDRAAALGVRLRPWEQALDDYLARSASDAAQPASALARGGLA